MICQFSTLILLAMVGALCSSLSAFKYCFCILGKRGIDLAAPWREYIAWTMFRIMRKLRLTKILRLGTSSAMFMDYFKGFEKSQAVRGIFGDKTDEVLGDLRVEFTWFGYMGVNDNDGHLMVNKTYLNSGDKTDIYLDVVHELCHVKQHLDGEELFKAGYEYVDRPTEVEAYRYTVQEAKRLGLSDKRILSYLQTEWMSKEDVERLVKNIGIDLHSEN